MTVEVAVNRPCCSGCGACVEVAPEIFALDADGVAVVRCLACPEDLARRAAAYCPEGCIETIS
jgi:ferredoxin